MRATTILLLSFAAAVQAGDTAALDKVRKELEPRLFTLKSDAIPLDEVLKLLQEKTGNSVADRRTIRRDNPKLRLDLQNATFWQALDEIAARAGCVYSLYQEDGTLSLVDGTPRKQNVAYAGICRLALDKVSLIRFEDNGSSFCDLDAELTWEPRFLPIYFDVEAVQAQFAAPKPRGGELKPVKIRGKGRTKVVGSQGYRAAVQFDMRLPAPPRTCPSIETLSCQLKLIGPAKMLTFRLADLKPAKEGVEKTQEDVKVSFKPLPPRRNLWAFDVTIQNPPGAHTFESNEFDDWLVYNRIFLEKSDGTRIEHKTGAWGPVDNEVISFKRAAIHYEFEGKMPEKTAGWSLVYRTPGRIVDVPANFTLKNIALP